MFSSESVRIASLCIVLASAETLHGIVRTVFVTPRIGKSLAIKISALSGTGIAFAICYLLVPPIGLIGAFSHLKLGLLLALFMAAFDIFIGKIVMRMRWPRILNDFNPASGNWLSVGLVALVFIPVLVSWLKN